MTVSTQCHKCKHVRSVPGNAHVRCTKPDPKMKGNPHGVANGWFIYPMLYDPIWMEVECSNYEEKEGISENGKR